MNFESMKNRYGAAIHNGTEYALTQQAYVDNYRDHVKYYASAIDCNGNQVQLAWDTTPEWNDATAQWEEFCRAYSNNGNMPPTYEMPSILDDESEACDWSNPSEMNVF